MLDVIAGLFIFVLVVSLWAMVGHGIWLLIAALGKAMFGGSPDPVATPCRHCGARHGIVRGRCLNCGQVETVALPASSLTNEIEGTLKQLDRLWRRGLLSDDEHARLRLACQRDLDRLRGAGALVAAPAPARTSDGIEFVPPERAPVAASPQAQPEPASAEIAYIEAEVVPQTAPRPAAFRPSAPPAHPLDRVETKTPPTP